MGIIRVIEVIASSEKSLMMRLEMR